MNPGPDTPRHRIGAVSSLTGVSTHALRLWERRYGAARPTRTPGGDRLYTDRDVERIKMMKQLIDAGHAISRVANLSEEALENLLARHRPAMAAPANAPEERKASEVFLDAIGDLDTAAAEQIMNKTWFQMAPRRFIFDFCIPVLVGLGDRWADGRMTPAHEHAASALIRNRIGAMMQAQPVLPGAPAAVVATPSGELHEFGALLAALLCSISGWRVLHLGPNLPPGPIARAAIDTNADAVLMSASINNIDQVEALRALLPENIRLIAGGQAASKLPRSMRMESLEDLEAWLLEHNERTS